MKSLFACSAVVVLLICAGAAAAARSLFIPLSALGGPDGAHGAREADSLERLVPEEYRLGDNRTFFSMLREDGSGYDVLQPIFVDTLDDIPPGLEPSSDTWYGDEHPDADAEEENGEAPDPANAVKIDTIIAIGKAAWTLIKDAKSKVNEKTDWTGAIPSGATSAQLSNYKDKTSSRFGWIYSNLFRVDVITFMWNFAMDCNGAYNGKGKFFYNGGASIQRISVAFGFFAEVTVSASNPVNYGTKTAPIAGRAVEVTMKSGSWLGEHVNKCRYILRGDCTFKRVNCDLYNVAQNKGKLRPDIPSEPLQYNGDGNLV